MSAVPHLMLIAAQDRSRFNLPDLARWAITGGVDAIQLREPALSPGERRSSALAIVDRLSSAAQVIVNEDLELAAELGSALHLPERSDRLRAARARLGPGVIIGRSVHSPESAAASNYANYVIAGHVFATVSKPGLPPIGLDGLAAIVAASSVPVLAVGGITAARIPAVTATGAYGVAIIGAIAAAPDPRLAAEELRQALDRSLKEQPVSIPESIETTITLTVNGKPLSLPAGRSIADLLQQRHLDQRLVAVEHNRSIVPAARFSSTLLAAGDEVEIVHFVGGG